MNHFKATFSPKSPIVRRHTSAKQPNKPSRLAQSVFDVRRSSKTHIMVCFALKSIQDIQKSLFFLHVQLQITRLSFVIYITVNIIPPQAI